MTECKSGYTFRNGTCRKKRNSFNILYLMKQADIRRRVAGFG